MGFWSRVLDAALPAYCPDCNKTMEGGSTPGGWFCPNCGMEYDRNGNAL